MAIKTTLEKIEELDAAISEVLTAQSLGKGDITILKAQYSALEEQRARLLTIYQQEQGTYYPRTYAGNAGRS